MTSIATFNEEDTATGRLHNISTTSFDHRIQEQQLANRHISETVNYIAWEPTHTTIDNIAVIINKRADKVKHRWSDVSYGEQLQNIPIFLRLCNLKMDATLLLFAILIRQILKSR